MHLTALLAALLVAAPVAAQTPAASGADPRWQPWLGCWELVTETARAGVDPAAPMRRQPALPGTRVCVAPADTPMGVVLTTWISDQHVLDDTIVADGTSRPFEDQECRGTQRTAWSENGQRLFTTASVTCGDQAPRKVDGLALLSPEGLWIDIQVIDVAGVKNVRVRRYSRVDDPRSHAAAAPLTALRTDLPVDRPSFTLADVIETSRVLAPEAVQAALVELESSFDLNARRLIDLDEAGVAGRVIDTMVALSYPERFIVERPRASGPSGGYPAMSLWPWLHDRMFWSSYYMPFDYRYWGYYNPWSYPGAGFVVIQPVVPSGDGQPPSPGRVVKDFGYTQVRARQPEPTIAVGSSGGGSQTSGVSGSGSGSSGSGGVSGEGYSSGGSGGSGRTAQPRPPGGQ
jgi:uncharacterized membrane protein YgcG